MLLGNYSVNAEGCERILAQVEDDEARAASSSTLRTRVTDAQWACSSGSGVVVRALEELWSNTLLLQADAAETKIGNAVAGVRQAVNIISEADRAMADAAGASLAQLQSGICRAPSLTGTR